MKYAFRLLACLLLCALCAACVPSQEKAQVRGTVKAYFNALHTQDFATADALAVPFEEGVSATIEQNAVNTYIFGQINYELLGIEKHDDTLYAHIRIEQVSLAKAYEKTVREYEAFLQSAQDNNRVFSDDAIQTKWNETFCRYIRETNETVVFDVHVPLIPKDGILRLCMTSEFRNALFGGELDAIQALETIRKGE